MDGFDLILSPSLPALPERTAGRIFETAGEYRLSLTMADARALAEANASALSHAGRLEFGPSAAERLIPALASSPYISPDDHAPMLHDMTELFYALKNDTRDAVSDGELICFIRNAFDAGGGSLEMVHDRAEALALHIRRGGCIDDFDMGDGNGDS